MKLSEVMQRTVEVITGDATLREAARRMSTLDVGALPVSVNGKIVGIVTDRDLVVRSLARGADPDRVNVAEAMTPEIEWCFDDESVEDAGHKMRQHQIQRLLVLDHEEALVGILSLAELVRAGADAQGVIEDIKSPPLPPSFGPGAHARHYRRDHSH